MRRVSSASMFMWMSSSEVLNSKRPAAMSAGFPAGRFDGGELSSVSSPAELRPGVGDRAGDVVREQAASRRRSTRRIAGRATRCLGRSGLSTWLLEVPPMKPGGLSDAELLQRLRAIYPEASVAAVAVELADARKKVAAGLGGEALVTRIHERYTYRMHDLGEFMKVLLLRFSRWFNTKHERTGALWESRFKSVLVEEGEAAKTIAAYIDLNPVRAGIVEDPADYRWSAMARRWAAERGATGKKHVPAWCGPCARTAAGRRMRSIGQARFPGNTGCCCCKERGKNSRKW
jgi:hypothetical protein